MTPVPDGVERLLALEDIRTLRAKYCSYIDNAEFDRMTDLFTEDFLLDLSPASRTLGHEAPPVQGRDAVVKHLAEIFKGATQALHITTIPIFEFQDGENATGIWRQETIIPGTGIAYATASDRYRKDNGEWRMSSVRVALDIIL